jgi:hypothetical protein
MAQTILSCSMRHTPPAGIPCLCRDSRTSRVPRVCAPAAGVPETVVAPPVSRSWLEPRRVVGSALRGGSWRLSPAPPLVAQSGGFAPSRDPPPKGLSRGMEMQVACDGCTYPRPPTKGFVSRVGGRPASEVFH